MAPKEYDLIVIGSGPAGEKAAVEAAKLRKATAIVERKSVQGGVCIHTGTIPSKTLRETVVYIAGLRQRSVYGFKSAVPTGVSIKELMYRKDQVIRQELEVIQQNLARHRIDVIQGLGKLLNPHTVEITREDGETTVIRGDIIVISTGTRPWHPPELEFDHKYIYDAESILNLDILPHSLTIIGGGVIGCEYASIFGHIGINVTLVNDQERLLPFLDREIADALVYLMRKYRINLVLGDGYKEIRREGEQVVTVTKSGRHVVSDRLLFAAGRIGNTNGMGLKELGIGINERGLIKVDKAFRSAVSSVYAVGDVIGFPSLASASMDQGRLAAIHAFGQSESCRINALLPYGIYTIPEVSMVGETEQSLIEKQIDYEVGIARYFELARGQIMNDHDGMLKLLFDPTTKRVLGVHMVGERATEQIHIGQAVMSCGGTMDYFVDTVFNYPTVSEAYKIAALDGLSRLATRL